MYNRLFLTLMVLVQALGISAQNNVKVKVEEGILVGTDASGIKIFKGIPLVNGKVPEPILQLDVNVSVEQDMQRENRYKTILQHVCKEQIPK